MIRALGFSDNPFDPRDPGRLCRGRERWIEPWEEDAPVEPVVRIVVSGATFTDDTAADARRGLPWSGVGLPELVEALFPRRKLLAFMEDGHPADIPEAAEGVEAYEGYRAGGRQELGLVRWHLHLKNAAAIATLMGSGPIEERVRGFAVLDAKAEVDDAQLVDRLFHLVGFSTLDSPPARFQPAALPEVLELVEAVVLLHRDKHGPAIGIYARKGIEGLESRLAKLCANAEEAAPPEGVERGVLLVPFAIPPMLARWDRALSELREQWQGPDPFPVPVGQREPERRGRRRWRRDDEDDALVPPAAEDQEEDVVEAVEE